MVRYKGLPYVSTSEVEYHPDRGAFVVWREKGIPLTMQGRTNQWIAAGYDVQPRRQGPYTELIARRHIGLSISEYVERWSVQTEMLQKSIWSLPAVYAEMGSYPGNGFGTGRGAYQKGITNAAETGGDLGEFYVGFPEASNVLDELSRGTDSYETEYTIISRDITFAFDTPPNPLILSTTKTVYTSAQLVATFNIPPTVLFQMPQDGSAPEQSRWGWRIRDQAAEVTNSTTGRHSISFVYAAWSDFFYP